MTDDAVEFNTWYSKFVNDCRNFGMVNPEYSRALTNSLLAQILWELRRVNPVPNVMEVQNV
jgi:hypothetical protein